MLVLSRFYTRVLLILGVSLTFLWVSFGYFNTGQYLPRPFGDNVEPFPQYNEEESRPQARHTYLKNGLLEVNPDAPHPIFGLIERAEALWKGKLGRQSKTLKAAVAEYKKRYRRDPPLGFDKWWDYTEKHDVQLRDEYDQIWLSLEPFWGLSAQKLEQLRAGVEKRSELDLFTITKEEGKNLTSTNKEHFDWAAENQLNLLWEVQDLLPPLKVTYSPHGESSNLLS